MDLPKWLHGQQPRGNESKVALVVDDTLTAEAVTTVLHSSLIHRADSKENSDQENERVRGRFQAHSIFASLYFASLYFLPILDFGRY